jgi:hypothetical protein
MNRQQRELHLLAVGSAACCGASFALGVGMLLPVIFAALTLIAARAAKSP